MNNPARGAASAWFGNFWRPAYRRLSQLFGRDAPDRSEPEVLQNDLGAAREERRARRYSAIPLTQPVLAAFAVEPLCAGDTRFIAREAELQRIAQALDMYRTGKSVTVAVVGRQGYGVTSLLRQVSLLPGEGETFCYGRLERRSQGATDTLETLCRLVGCELPVESLEEVVDFVNSLTPRVFAIDNAQYLASRIMGSEDAVSDFATVLAATRARHLWVVGFEQYAWRRLGYVYRAQRFFDVCIELPAFSETEFGQCFTERLGAAGLAPPAEATAEPGQLPALLATALPDLVRLSDGKPDLAFFYFLDALFMDEDSRQLSTRPVTPLDFGALKQLVQEELFTLAEIAAHGRLTIDDHRALFRIGAKESWLMLEHLYHLCLLDRDEDYAGELSYRLMPPYSNIITRFLTNANYLY